MKLSSIAKGIIGILLTVMLIVALISGFNQKSPLEKTTDNLKNIEIGIDEEAARQIQEGIDKVRGK